MSLIQYQIDTKEKFNVITILNKDLSSNLVPELAELTSKWGNTPQKNLIINLQNVEKWDDSVIEQITLSQGQFYEKNTSFVICALSDQLLDNLDKTEYAELLNMTPTESEAWDIVQMEEIERELLDSDDMEFNIQNEE
jgi:anti-anti-sigma regulatory factor